MIIQAKKPKKIWLIVVIGGLLSVVIVGVCWFIFINKSAQNNAQPNNNTVNNGTNGLIDNTKVKTSTVHFAAMGDMLAHDTIITNAKTDGVYNFQKFFTNIRISYQSADVVFCNQEGLSAGEKWGISGYPSFNAPTELSEDL